MLYPEMVYTDLKVKEDSTETVADGTITIQIANTTFQADVTLTPEL